jgi:hypothetical protein
MIRVLALVLVVTAACVREVDLTTQRPPPDAAFVSAIDAGDVDADPDGAPPDASIDATIDASFTHD